MILRGDPRRRAGARRREDRGPRREDETDSPQALDGAGGQASSIVAAVAPGNILEEELDAVVEDGEAPGEETAGDAPAGNALRDQVLRLQAEFDNYRKRQARDFHRLCAQGRRDLIEELLVILDDIDRAREHFEAGSPPGEIIPGLFQTAGQMEAILRKEGLEAMSLEPLIPFDPNMHEAVIAEDCPWTDHDIVLEIFRRGYAFEKELLRPALVKVGRAPHKPGTEPGSEPEPEAIPESEG